MRTNDATNKKTASRLATAAPECLEVLEEFVRDVEAVGVRYLAQNEVNDLAGSSWPDIVVTFRRAVRAIKKARGTRL